MRICIHIMRRKEISFSNSVVEVKGWENQRKYIKSGSRVISVHSNLNGGEEELEIATSGEHFYIVKDAEMNYVEIPLLRMEISRKQRSVSIYE